MQTNTPTTPPNTTLPAFTVSEDYAKAQRAAAPVPVVVKSGVLSSEFWLHIVALLAPVIYNTLAHSDNVAVVAAAQAAAAIYTLSRTVVKSQAISNAATTAAPK